MPFRESKQGVSVWVDQTPEQIQAFKQSLHQDVLERNDLPTAVQSQLNQFARETLVGAERLANANITGVRSLEKALGAGVSPVDIIVPVYGNIQVLKPCLESIIKNTSWPYKITIVDDTSDGGTIHWIEQWSKANPQHQVLFNKQNKGFSTTVNRGIRATSNQYICILNSDVIVTPNWMTKMILALESDPKNKIVNPCTNNTAVINVPLQEGASYLDMNRAIEATSSKRYPEIMPTGFCFLTNRNLINSIGAFDEGYESYGEETDFWMRTITRIEDGEYPRWKAVLADDTYLFHERGTSFSSLGHGSHMEKRRTGSERFHAVWPGFKQWQQNFDVNKAVGPVRSPYPPYLLNDLNAKYNIAFVVYSPAYCGGMRFIADIVNYLNEHNVNAKVVHVRREKEKKVEPLGELRCAPVVFNSPEDFVRDFPSRVFSNGVVVSATNELTPLVHMVCSQSPNLQSLLFAQSNDPAISPNGGTRTAMEKAFEFAENIITNSKYLNNEVKEKYGHETLGFIRPGVDQYMFYPRGRHLGDERPTVMFCINNSYPFKGAERGIAVARELAKKARENEKEIRILAYGVTSIPDCIDITGLGGLSQSNLANLLGREVDIFVDPSSIHTYGLPSLEAMVSGAVPVLWDNHGVNEYARNNHNAMILKPDASNEQMVNTIYTLLFVDTDKLQKLRKNGIKTKQYRAKAVTDFVDLVEEKLKLKTTSRVINIITPHLRKFGGPSTIIQTANLLHDAGHDVRLYTVYPDMNPEVINTVRVPIYIDWNDHRTCDVLISNSDNPHNDIFVDSKQAKKKILLKLSHNKRFQELEDKSLKMDWDAVITSTEWLKDVCIHPRLEEGWTHPPQNAKRVGWFHYEHYRFDCSPANRQYGSLDSQVNLCTLVHHYPLKGTKEGLETLAQIKQKHQNKVSVAAVGEWADFRKQTPPWMKYFYNLGRDAMAKLMKEVDIWVVASHTEGLGRLALEAMSAGVAVVLTDTGAEFAEHEKNCLVVKQGDQEGLVEAVDKLVMDKELRMEIAREGYRTACQVSNPTGYVENLNTVINGVFDD